MGRMGFAAGICLALVGVSRVRAELAWPPPVRTFASADGSTQFQVTPSETATEPATGRAFRRGKSGDEALWEVKLINTPDRAFLAANGSAITVENVVHQWDQHAVVVYDTHGQVIADVPLNRFLSYQEVMDRKAANRESVVLWDDSWTGSCRFEVRDRANEFVVEPPSGLIRRISLSTGEIALGEAGAKLDPPVVSLAGLSSRNGRSVVFEVLNPNDAPLFYSGYTRESFSPPIPAGEMHPLYDQEVMRNGAWEKVDVGHCGTGRGEVFIPARGSQKFWIPLIGDLPEPIRYGIHWQGEKGEWSKAAAWGPAVRREELDRLPKLDE